MKLSRYVTLIVVLLAIVFGFVDQMYLKSRIEKFKEIEKQRINTSNKLNTAKIVHGNLNHVYELVTENMVFENVVDSVTRETKFFRFVTQCVNDLKLELMAVRPIAPVVEGSITKYGYEIEVEGDYFKFGELCSKFENSRRIIAMDKFKVSLDHDNYKNENGNKTITVSMRVTTYAIAKQANSIEVAGKE